jgi:uncharacterized protein (TIRG00374 family)
MKQLVLWSLKMGIGFGAIGFLVVGGHIDLNAIKQSFRAGLPWLLLGGGVHLLLTVLVGTRWYYLLIQGGASMPWWKVFKLHMIGLFFVSVLPGSTGGDFVKGYYLYTEYPKYRGTALASLVLDRVIGFWAMMTWAVLGILLNFSQVWSNESLKYGVLSYGVVLIVAFLGLVWLFLPATERFFLKPRVQKSKLGKSFGELFGAIQVYRKKPKALVIAFAMTLVVHGGVLVTFYLGAKSLGGAAGLLTLVDHSLVTPLLTVVNGLPISPAGIGVGEVAASTLYGWMGVSEGAEIQIINRFYTLLVALLGAPFYLLYRKRSPNVDTGR